MNKTISSYRLLNFHRLSSTATTSSTSGQTDLKQSKIVSKSIKPIEFTSITKLSKYLVKNLCAHAPGRFVIIPKPYGISCVGYKDEQGGIFKSSVHDESKLEKWQNAVKRSKDDSLNEMITISDCIEEMAKILREPRLTFCTGLKRYYSGAIVLPCNPDDAESIKKSLKRSSSGNDTLYRGLAITVGRPYKQSGHVEGFATFRNVGKHKEYIFEERTASKRARTGKYAVSGNMTYRVLGTRNNCSLVEFSVDKFARHMPRLILSKLGSPILGDTLYWRRIADIDGKPELVEAGQMGHKIWIPSNLGHIVEIKDNRKLLTSLPIYCHIYSTSFGMIDGHEDQGLIAGCNPPSHFKAMLQCLGLSSAYRSFMKEESDDNNDMDPGVIVSGETKF